MTNFSFETTLRDGTSIAVRPVGPDDGHLIEIGMDHLSKKSRYFRFLHPVAKLSEKDLHRFSQIDHVNHIAWGALDLTRKEAYPVGLARCIRVDNDAVTAEVAIAIVDSHQGRGVGTILLGAIAFDAARKGIKQFSAIVLADNHKMLSLFAKLDTTNKGSQGVLDLNIKIHKLSKHYPDNTTGAVFRNVYRLLNSCQQGQSADN